MFIKPLHNLCSLYLLNKYFNINLRVVYYTLLITHVIIIITTFTLLCNISYIGDTFWSWYFIYTIMCLAILDINLISTVYTNLNITNLIVERNNNRS